MITRDNTALYIAYKVAWKYVGLWYKWGGDDPAGFDCSGYVGEIIKSVGYVSRKEKLNAAQLYDRFKDKKVEKPRVGVLLFLRKNGRICHVEFCISDKLAIGASGGGSSVTNEEEAIKKNAFIKVRPIYLRWSDEYEKIFLDPFLEV